MRFLRLLHALLGDSRPEIPAADEHAQVMEAVSSARRQMKAMAFWEVRINKRITNDYGQAMAELLSRMGHD